MKKFVLIIILVLSVSISMHSQIVSATTAAAVAIVNLGYKAYNAAPDASYYVRVVKDGDVKYTPVSSCQMALEMVYDLFIYQNVDEVRIVTENSTIHPSCRNRTYYPADVSYLRERRDK